MNHNQTYLKKINHPTQSKWYIIDAKEKTLGRISTIIANTLRGKNTIDYTPNITNAIHVIVINSKLVKVTGQKTLQKLYKRHSGRPGGLKIENFKDLQNRIPNRIIEKSVKGMLPKGALGRKLFTQLKVYENTHHPHQAQKPDVITLN
uniref:Ribosomal protein L13 n=1 Tax=Antithamnionella ternifolia TaxID=207919 RepID=A0A4D6WR69_9FLOR|nr:ribosomal protein L13 [Antithamnionella ternifolia]